MPPHHQPAQRGQWGRVKASPGPRLAPPGSHGGFTPETAEHRSRRTRPEPQEERRGAEPRPQVPAGRSREGSGALITRSDRSADPKPARGRVRECPAPVGPAATPATGRVREGVPPAGRCTSVANRRCKATTGDPEGQPCHYRSAGSDRACRWRGHPLGQAGAPTSATDKGRVHKGVARFARTSPALEPSHLCNNPTGHCRPFKPERTTEHAFPPDAPPGAPPKPPPTCTAPRARHGGAKRGNH